VSVLIQGVSYNPSRKRAEPSPDAFVFVGRGVSITIKILTDKRQSYITSTLSLSARGGFPTTVMVDSAWVNPTPFAPCAARCRVGLRRGRPPAHTWIGPVAGDEHFCILVRVLTLCFNAVWTCGRATTTSENVPLCLWTQIKSTTPASPGPPSGGGGGAGHRRHNIGAKLIVLGGDLSATGSSSSVYSYPPLFCSGVSPVSGELLRAGCCDDGRRGCCY